MCLLPDLLHYFRLSRPTYEKNTQEKLLEGHVVAIVSLNIDMQVMSKLLLAYTMLWGIS